MHLHDLMGWRGPMTHWQYLIWQAWLRAEWNRPSKDNWYAMGVMCQVARVLSTTPNSIQPAQFKLPFRFPDEEPEGPKETAAEFSKRRRERDAGMIGSRGKEPSVRRKTRAEIDADLRARGLDVLVDVFNEGPAR